MAKCGGISRHNDIDTGILSHSADQAVLEIRLIGCICCTRMAFQQGPHVEQVHKPPDILPSGTLLAMSSAQYIVNIVQ